MLTVVTYATLTFYVALIVLLTIGLLKLERFSQKSPMKSPISLIICCKNEEENLPNLLRTIATQTHQNFEVIFANDHSTDNTAKLLDEFCQNHHFAHYFSIKKFGKKNALTEAVALAQNELLVFTDADCQLHPEHLATVAAYFDTHHPDLLIGTVRMSHDKRLFTQLQALEFASLVASTAGACGVRRPIMCNGANLACKKSVWLKHQQQLCHNEISGDDMFLLHAIKAVGGKIDYLKSDTAIVDTKPSTTLRQFMQQRGRWTSKTTSYTDWQTIAVALVVFVTSVAIFADFIGIFLGWCSWPTLLVAFVTKWLCDTIFLALFLPYIQQKNLIRHTLLLSLIYPFYTIAAVVVGLFNRKKW